MRMMLLATLLLATQAFAAPFVYVGNSTDATVSVIDAATNTVVKTITVFGGVSDIAVSGDGKRVYVAYGNAIAVIDTATHTVIGTVVVPNGAVAIALSPEGRWLYAVDGDYPTPALSQIDMLRGVVVGTVAVDPKISSVAVSQDGSEVIASHNGLTTATRGMTRIDPMILQILERSGVEPLTRIIHHPYNAYELIAAIDDKVDFNYLSPLGRVAFPSGVGDIAPAGSVTVILTIPGSNLISRAYLPGFFLGPVFAAVPSQPARVAVDLTTAQAYVTNPPGGKTWAFDAQTLVPMATIDVGRDPIAVAARPIVPRGLRHGRDFDGSGTSDLLLRKTATGAIYELDVNGVSNTQGAATLLSVSGLVPTHTGYFGIASRAGILWRNTISGSTEMWFNHYPYCCGTWEQRVLLSDPPWRVTHVADVDGDGMDDIVWRNTATGQSAIWLMNGFDVVDTIGLSAPSQWQVTHTGDFDGDGVQDLVWRNTATGETAIWLMNDGRFASGAIVLARADWSVVLVGDFDGDGKSDLVWRNAATGETAIWLMNGTAMKAGAILVTSTDWAPTHVGDFNGDGSTDLIWRNGATGETNVWLMSGLSFAGANLLTDPQWSVVEVGNHSGRGNDDILWRNAATGYTAIWFMNGLAPSFSSNPFTTLYDILP